MTDPTYGSTANTGGSATDQVKDQVRDKAQLAQDKTRGALGQARGRLRDQVDQRSTQAGDQVQSAAQDVRKVAEQLRGQGKDTPARMAEQAADRAESFGSTYATPTASGCWLTRRPLPAASPGWSWPAGWRWALPPRGS